MPALAALPKPATNPNKPVPESRFEFEALGIPGLSQNFLNIGSSMLTVHFVDKAHLLVTYGTRDLVPRIPGDPAEDEDRIVAAELVELPGGKILARTRWHLHDHARYLWSLGQGRFLLREGVSLSTFAPLANLGTPDPFFRVALPYRNGLLDAVFVSPDMRLLTLETHAPQKQKLTGVDVNTLTRGSDAFPKESLFFDFYRISGDGTEASPFKAVKAGTVRAPQPLHLPVDADGYLVATGGKRGRWPVEFEQFGGKPLQVGIVDSSCQPAMELVSPTQWLAFTCRSATTDSVTVAAYDFAKHEIWEEPIGPLNPAPVFALAPAAGRFAMSRRLESTQAQNPMSGDPPSGPVQEVRVYGTQTGDLLLKVNCTPTFRTSENFDISPDGMRLAVVRSGGIEMFRLPELTKIDREDLAELEKLVPTRSLALVDLHRLSHEADRNSEMSTALAAADAEKETPPAAPVAPKPAVAASAPVTPAASAGSFPQGETQSASGDTETRRKPPTLLNPGEKAEVSDKPPSTKP